MKCGRCDKTDGICYTSNPPKRKCTITGEFHEYNDECDIVKAVLAPIELPLYASCIVCGESVELSHEDRMRVEYGCYVESKVCDKCKAVILHIREQMENRNENC